MATPSRPSLHIETRRRASALVVFLRGSVGIREAETLSQKLQEAAGQQPPVAVLELSGMDFICSQGLGALVNFEVRMKGHGGKVRLVQPQPHVRSVLETTRLIRLFEVYPAVEEALGAS